MRAPRVRRMRWSKLKALVEARFAPGVARRVAIHGTRYGTCTCGRAWLTVDGAEVANFCTRLASDVRLGRRAPASLPADHALLSRQDAYAACWAFVHELAVEDALADADPLVQSLAVLDDRVGKRRPRALDPARLHPLARRMLALRREVEGAACGVAVEVRHPGMPVRLVRDPDGNELLLFDDDLAAGADA